MSKRDYEKIYRDNDGNFIVLSRKRISSTDVISNMNADMSVLKSICESINIQLNEMEDTK